MLLGLLDIHIQEIGNGHQALLELVLPIQMLVDNGSCLICNLPHNFNCIRNHTQNHIGCSEKLAHLTRCFLHNLFTGIGWHRDLLFYLL